MFNRLDQIPDHCEFDPAALQAASSALGAAIVERAGHEFSRMNYSDLQHRRDPRTGLAAFQDRLLITSSMDAPTAVGSARARRRDASLLTTVQDEHGKRLAGALLLSTATATM
ncbi:MULTISPECIES: hypothetical protein [Mesorhizobium]|uniref:hypothetical protein n=1 Tax=Mesorhizobium TaxID=68287 RepID=UPI0012FE9AB8|nr:MULTISPECIES: hypothetical protein [Mesorhizobium]